MSIYISRFLETVTPLIRSWLWRKER